jgi:hypothetical protein
MVLGLYAKSYLVPACTFLVEIYRVIREVQVSVSNANLAVFK